MPKKILFTDMDGTLLTSDKKVTLQMRALIRQMIDQGAHFVLSSGRALSSVISSAQANGLLFDDTIIIAANGNLVYDHRSRQLLLEKRVPRQLAYEIVKIANDLHLHIQSYDDTHVLSPNSCPELDYYMKATGMSPRYAQDIIAAYDKDPIKLLAISLHDQSRLELLRSKVMERFSDKLTAIYSCNEYLEMFDKTAGKGNAVRFVCEYLQIPLEDSVAAGDAENDISMLQAAGAAVVMKNGHDKVKECADFITQNDNNHDGLAEAIRYYFF